MSNHRDTQQKTTVLRGNYLSNTNKPVHRKEIRFVLTGGGKCSEGGLGEDCQKVQTFSYKKTKQVKCMISRINTAICSI